jgi:hypothetical protein
MVPRLSLRIVSCSNFQKCTAINQILLKLEFETINNTEMRPPCY